MGNRFSLLRKRSCFYWQRKGCDEARARASANTKLLFKLRKYLNTNCSSIDICILGLEGYIDKHIHAWPGSHPRTVIMMA